MYAEHRGDEAVERLRPVPVVVRSLIDLLLRTVRPGKILCYSRESYEDILIRLSRCSTR